MNSAESMEARTWQLVQTVERDRRELRASVSQGAVGLILAGAGIGAMISGHPEGLAAVGGGGFLVYIGGSEARHNFEQYTQSVQSLSERQGQGKAVSILTRASRDV